MGSCEKKYICKLTALGSRETPHYKAFYWIFSQSRLQEKYFTSLQNQPFCWCAEQKVVCPTRRWRNFSSPNRLRHRWHKSPAFWLTGCYTISKTLFSFLPSAHLYIPGGAVGASPPRKSFSGWIICQGESDYKMCAARTRLCVSARTERPHLQFYKYVSVISLQLVCRAPHAAERAKKRELLKLECTQQTSVWWSLKGGFSASGLGREHKVFRVEFIAFLKCRWKCSRGMDGWVHGWSKGGADCDTN